MPESRVSVKRLKENRLPLRFAAVAPAYWMLNSHLLYVQIEPNHTSIYPTLLRSGRCLPKIRATTASDSSFSMASKDFSVERIWNFLRGVQKKQYAAGVRRPRRRRIEAGRLPISDRLLQTLRT